MSSPGADPPGHEPAGEDDAERRPPGGVQDGSHVPGAALRASPGSAKPTRSSGGAAPAIVRQEPSTRAAPVPNARTAGRAQPATAAAVAMPPRAMRAVPPTP